MITKPSLSIIMPAYNEGPRLRAAYDTVVRAVKKSGIDDYEILMTISISPDGTHDGTPDTAKNIAEEDPHVKLPYTPGFKGMGYRFREGLSAATKDYVIMVPGANHILEKTLVNVFGYIGKIPLVLTYNKGDKARPLYVRFVSKGFVVLCNLLFGLNMKYFNGIALYPRKLLLKVPTISYSPAYNAEILIYLLKSNIDYIELPQEINPNTVAIPGRTFMLKNVLPSVKTLISLFWKIHFQKKRVPIK